jgi:hypothetical protein
VVFDSVGISEIKVVWVVTFFCGRVPQSTENLPVPLFDGFGLPVVFRSSSGVVYMINLSPI